MDPAELAQALAASDLPKLWLPKRAVLPVEALPVIRTGKLALRRAKEIAQEKRLAIAFPFDRAPRLYLRWDSDGSIHGRT